MKKTVFYLMLSALVVSCSNEELFDKETSATTIGFQALTTGVKSRSIVETNGVNMKDNSFEVYSFTEAGKLFMGKQLSTWAYELSQGVEIKYKDNSWDYADAADRAFWPVEKLNFYAFHPMQSVSDGYTIEVSSDEKQVVRYALPTVAEFQKDIMYAISRGVDRTTNDGKVRLLFRHALSQVCFKAKTELGSMTVDIEDLKVHNVGIRGDLTLPLVGEEITTENWTIDKLERITYMPKNMKESVTEIGTEAKEIVKKFFIPQVLTQWDPETNNIDAADKAGQSYLSILCKIRQNGVLLWGGNDKYVRLFVPFGVKWEPGKRYTYTLVFGGGYDEQGNKVISPINFEVEEQQWQDSSYEMNVD